MIKIKKSVRLPQALVRSLEQSAEAKGKIWSDLMIDILVDYFTDEAPRDIITEGYLDGWMSEAPDPKTSPMDPSYDLTRPIQWESLFDNIELIKFRQNQNKVSGEWYYEDVCWVIVWVWFQLFRHTRRPPIEKFHQAWMDADKEHPAYIALRLASLEVSNGDPKFIKLLERIQKWIKEEKL